MRLKVERTVRVSYIVDASQVGFEHVMFDEQDDPMGMIIDAHLDDKTDVSDYHFEILENSITMMDDE